jgi:hypothetical protein
MTQLEPNTFYKDGDGKYIEILEVDSTWVTVKHQSTDTQERINRQYVEVKISVYEWILQGSAKPGPVTWPDK